MKKIKTQAEFNVAMEMLKNHVADAQKAKINGDVEAMVDAINDANALSGSMAEYVRLCKLLGI